jgi:uncharacterized delta-60 repeat protein
LCQQGDGRWWFAGNFTNVQNAPFRSVGRFGPEPESPPAIVSQPSALTSQAGRDFWMGVTVSGFPLPQIQWQFNGQDIAGATNAQLVLPSVLPAKAGTYTVVVSNSLGTVQSSPISLAVPLPPGTPGSVDPAFVPPYSGKDVACVLVQPDGRVFFGYDAIWQPVGGSPLFRLNPDGSPDATFQVAPLGTSFVYFVEALAMRADGRLIASVAAQSYPDSTTTSEILRLGPDGEIEATLSVIGPCDAPYKYSEPVTAFCLQTDGRILLAGRFTKIGSVPRAGVARLNADGTLDEAFDPGPGLDGKVAVFAANQDGRVLIGGAFTNVWGVLRQGIARLNAEGSLDASFDAGADGSVSQIYLEPDGHVVINGSFRSISGVARSHLVRLNADGELDATFDPGATRVGEPSISSASCLGMLPDGRMIARCALTDTNGVDSTRIVQLKTDGSLDPSFDVGLGPNRTNRIPKMALQADGRIILAGNFNLFNGFRRNGLVRLFGSQPRSGPQLRNPVLAGNTFSVQFLTTAGATYTLEFTDSLSAPAWTPLPGATLGNGDITSLTDPAATNRHRFYRVHGE